MNSTEWWQKWYASGGTSGAGSRDALLRWKAGVVNELITDYGITSLMDIGCGDGHQAQTFEVKEYYGFDVAKHPDWPDHLEHGELRVCDMAISLDVAYHLIEDDLYEEHLNRLFGYARKLVVLYTMPDDSRDMLGHMKYRKPPKADREIENAVDSGGCTFYIYEM